MDSFADAGSASTWAMEAAKWSVGSGLIQGTEPLVKKHFPGGVYAAHMIPIGAFEEWALLSDWLTRSDRYEYNGNGSPDNMFDSLEEALNYVNRASMHDAEGEKNLQLDLLIPVKEKNQIRINNATMECYPAWPVPKPLTKGNAKMRFCSSVGRQALSTG